MSRRRGGDRASLVRVAGMIHAQECSGPHTCAAETERVYAELRPAAARWGFNLEALSSEQAGVLIDMYFAAHPEVA